MSRPLWLVFAFALAPRLFFWQQQLPDGQAALRPDSPSYLAPADSLAAGRGFLGTDGRLDTVRTPGYPLFLAPYRSVSKSPLPPSLAQCLVDAATAALVSLTATALTGHPSAWLAGFLYALDPVAAAHAPLILSETWFTFLLTSAVWLAALRAPESGLFVGLAALTRPIALYLWLPWSLLWGRRAWLVALLAAAPPALWCARNYARFGAFEFSSITGVNVLFWEGAAVKAAAEGLPFEEARRRLVAAEPLEAEAPFARSKRQKALGTAIMKEHPGAVLKVHAVSVGKMLLAPGLDAVAQASDPRRPLPALRDEVDKIKGGGTRALLRERPLLWAPFLWTLALLGVSYLAAAVGAWKLGRRGLPALVPLLYLVAISSGGWAYYRFRVPMMPLIAVLAAGALLRGRSSAPSGGGPAA